MKLNEAIVVLNDLADKIDSSICPETNDGRVIVYPADYKAIEVVLGARRWRKLANERPTEEGHYLTKRTWSKIPQIGNYFKASPDEQAKFCFEDEITHWLPINGPEVTNETE